MSDFDKKVQFAYRPGRLLRVCIPSSQIDFWILIGNILKPFYKV